MNLRLTSALLSLCLAATTLSDQTYTPKTILFTGSSADPKALTQLAALTPAKPIAGPDIDAAMNRLADTGLFADIRYTVDDRALTFILTPQLPNLMIPAVFANFVLWKPEDLTPLVHARVPLFTGSIPTNGTLQQSVTDALTAIVSEKLHAPAHVDSILAQDEFTKAKSIVFTITQPTVQIHQVHIAGVSPIASPKVLETSDTFVSTEFDRHSPEAVRQRLDSTYKDLGFLDIALDPPTAGDPTITPDHILIDIATTAHEGGQYHISTLTFPASPIVPPADFVKASTLKVGDPASRIELLSTTRHLQTEFNHHGYMDSTIDMQYQKDAAAHTVSYTFTANPGPLYAIRGIRAVNATPQLQQDLDAHWKLPPNTSYDAPYVSNFMAHTASNAAASGYIARFLLNPNHKDRTIDLVVTFVAAPQRPH